MSSAVIEGKNIKSIFDQYKFCRYTDNETSKLAAQICIANLMRTFNGIFTRQQILDSVGKAISPNAVSLAVREIHLS